jgi:hypothetical protein
MPGVLGIVLWNVPANQIESGGFECTAPSILMLVGGELLTDKN